MKNNKGISIISFILTILILILIIFLGYEVFYVDIFDIKEETLVSEEESKTNKIYINYQNTTKNTENISTIEPIIDNNNLRIYSRII